MINRITTASTMQLMLGNLAGNQRGMVNAQNQLSTGKKLNSASDNPADAVVVLDQRARLNRSKQLGANLDRAKDWLNQMDDLTASSVERMSSARTLVVQAVSGANDAAGRTAIANQIRALRQSLLATANTQYLGRPVLAGTSGAGAAYDAAGTFQGDAGAINIPVAAGVTVQVNATGPQLFGTADPLTPANGDIFQQLDVIANAIEAGDQTAVQAGLTQIDTATKRIEQIQVTLGARSAQLDDLKASATAAADEMKASISDLEDVDMAEATLAFKSQEAAYQAALAVTAKVIQPSLMDFLR